HAPVSGCIGAYERPQAQLTGRPGQGQTVQAVFARADLGPGIIEKAAYRRRNLGARLRGASGQRGFFARGKGATMSEVISQFDQGTELCLGSVSAGDRIEGCGDEFEYSIGNDVMLLRGAA